MGRDLRRTLVQPPAQSKLAVRSDQFLRALSSLVLKASKDGDCKTPLESSFCCLTVLIVTKFLITTSQSVSISLVPVVSPPAVHHCEVGLAPSSQ